MSRELTLEIMGLYNLGTSVQEVIAFVAESALSAAQEKALKEAVTKMEIPDGLIIKDASELKKFLLENEELIPVPSQEVAMFLRELPDRLDQKKSIAGYENLLKITPVEFLNKYTLVYLIEKTMNQTFWEKRVTSPDNKRIFGERYGVAMASILPEFGSAPVSYEDAKRAYDSAITPQDKILSLRYLIHIKSSGHFGKDYFDTNLSPLPVAEQLDNLEKDFKFLDMQDNAEAASGEKVRAKKDIIMDHDEIEELPKGTILAHEGDRGSMKVKGDDDIVIEGPICGFTYTSMDEAMEFWELD